MPRKHRVRREQQHTYFDRAIPPACRVRAGDIVTFETDDTPYEMLWRDMPMEREHLNAVTGPVYVIGARAGDALKIEILDITVERAWVLWSQGPLWDYNDGEIIRPVHIEGKTIHISERLRIPLAPAIGCIGCAPREGLATIHTPVYRWGGNLDLTETVKGATVYLPVQVRGALLSLGDVHASIGANEGTWAGLESRARVTVRVGVVPKMGLTSPRIRLGKTTICVAIEDTVEEACMVAMRRAYYLLTAEMGFTPYEAYAYCAARVHLRLGGPNGLREESYGIVLAYVPDIE
jgi:amidase